MINVIKKLVRLFVLSLGLFGSAVFGSTVHAAADPDLTIAIASTTAILDDNKSLVLGYMVSVFLFAFIVMLLKVSLLWGLKTIARAIGGGGGRRR